MSKVQRLSRKGVQVTTKTSDLEKVTTFYFYVLKDPRDGLIKYVGRTVNLPSRYRNHIYEAKKNNRTKKDRWIVSLLRRNKKPIMKKVYTLTCSLGEAINTEKMLYKKLISRFPLKNMGDAFLGNVLTGTPVYQFDMSGKYINSYTSAFQAQIATGIKDCNISRCCKLNNGHAGKYLWSFKNTPYIYSKGDSCKVIIQTTKEGIFINEFLSARVAHKSTGVPYKKISAVCNGRQKSSGGYCWKFKG